MLLDKKLPSLKQKLYGDEAEKVIKEEAKKRTPKVEAKKAKKSNKSKK